MAYSNATSFHFKDRCKTRVIAAAKEIEALDFTIHTSENSMILYYHQSMSLITLQKILKILEKHNLLTAYTWYDIDSSAVNRSFSDCYGG